MKKDSRKAVLFSFYRYGDRDLEKKEKEEKNKYFEAALQSFTYDFANGGIIRHLTDEGYSISEIQKRLTSPGSYERLKEEVYNYLAETGRLLESIDDEEFQQIDSSGSLKAEIRERIKNGSLNKTCFVLLDKQVIATARLKLITDSEKEYILELPEQYFVPCEKSLELILALTKEVPSAVKIFICKG